MTGWEASQISRAQNTPYSATATWPSPGSGDTVANLGYPASVRLAFSDEGRKQLQDRLSAACMRQPVPAYLFAGDWVVTTQGTGCRSVAFRWTQSLGTIRLP